MALDPGIPLALTPRNPLQAGIDQYASLADLGANLQQRAWAMKQAQENERKRRAILQLYQDPSNYDENGYFNLQGIQKIHAIDPAVGENAAMTRSKLLSAQEQINERKTKEMKAKEAFGLDAIKQFQGFYQEAKGAGIEEGNANQFARGKTMENIDRMKKAGLFPGISDRDWEGVGQLIGGMTGLGARTAINAALPIKEYTDLADLQRARRLEAEEGRDEIPPIIDKGGVPLSKIGQQEPEAAGPGEQRKAVNRYRDVASGAIAGGVEEAPIEGKPLPEKEEAPQPKRQEPVQEMPVTEVKAQRMPEEEGITVTAKPLTEADQIRREIERLQRSKSLVTKPNLIKSLDQQIEKKRDALRKIEGMELRSEGLEIQRKRLDLAQKRLDSALKMDQAIELDEEGATVAAMRRLYTGEAPRGYGKASTALRIKIDNLAAHIGNEMGLSATEQALLPKENGIKFKAMDKLTTWASTIGRIQQKLELDTNVLIDYARKLNPSILRRIGQVFGNPQTVNNAANIIQKEFNDPIANAYVGQLEGVRREWARMMSGPTSNAMLPVEAMKKGAQMISAGVDVPSLLELKRVMMMDGNNTMRATTDQINFLRQSITSGGREAPFKTQEIPPSSKPSAEPTIRNDADYDKLPSGSYFIGPDGKRRRKP